MKKLMLILYLFLTGLCYADGGATATYPTKFEELDGSPSVPATRVVVVDNGTLTDNGGREVRLTKWVSAPGHKESSGVDGQMAKDASYLYVYVSSEWERIAWDSTWEISSALILESGGYFLLESGGKLLLE